MIRFPSRPLRISLKPWLLALPIVFAVMAGNATNVAAQPNPGIDPCTRALARMATPAVSGTPGPEVFRLTISQTVMNFASCFNRQNWNGVLALTTTGFLASFLGASEGDNLPDRLDRLAARGLLPQLRIQSIEENGTFGTSSASLAVTWQGWNGLHLEFWQLQPEDGNWLLNARTIDRPTVSGVAAGVQLNIGDDGLSTPRTDLVNPGTVIFAFANRTSSDQTALVLSVPAGSTVADAAATCSANDRTPLAPTGLIQVPVGTTVYLPMMQLPAGRYAIVTGVDPCTGSAAPPPETMVIIDVTS